MKWYSVKKYRPAASFNDNILIRYFESFSKTYILEIAHYFENAWVDTTNLEPIEDDKDKVTHFCLIPPIEIEDHQSEELKVVE
jgi:hypothetical protein